MSTPIVHPVTEHDWCRIIQIEGVCVLFYEEFDNDQGRHQLVAMVKTDGAMFTIKLTNDVPFSQTQFNDFATKNVARAAILQACDRGLGPVRSPAVLEDAVC